MTESHGMPVTGGGKGHFEVLDGLRGSAAFLIVTFHAFNYTFNFQGPWALVPRAYLAVDFFFALSGFVVAYAYDERWQRMTATAFFRLRLIRLHPMVLFGATLGMLGYVLDPHAPPSNHTPWPLLALVWLMSLALLPSLPVGGRPDETQALNGPAWSLMQEYLGNVAYALLLRRLRTATLVLIVVVSAIALGVAANVTGSLDGGWDYPRIWMAPLRLSTSFVLGLVLFRTLGRLRMPRLGLLPLSLLLAACFEVPPLATVGFLFANGLLDMACILLLFPLIILCGAHSQPGKGLVSWCRLSGRLSYPLYISHIAFIYALTHYVHAHHLGTPSALVAITVTMAVSIAVAGLALKYYDEPIRHWLKRRIGGSS